MGELKKCCACKLLMDNSYFNNNKSKPDGLADECKSCKAKYRANRAKTERGVILRIFNNQKRSSKNRGHRYGMYSKQEFSEWMYANGFKKLYDDWVLSGYQTEEKPSVDRIDEHVGYELDNIRIMKWRENRSKAHEYRRMGLGTCGESCSPVVGVSKHLDIMREVVSINSAERDFKLDKKRHLDSFKKDPRGIYWFRKETYERLKEFLLTYNQ